MVYDASWPEETRVLKAGETLTYPGGEYQADHPDAPGLPGVIGWAAGTVVYDSVNPTMDNKVSLTNPNLYTARFITPLETLTVELPLDSVELAAISPASGLTSADGTVWQFTGLSASLQKRVFFSPLDKELGISGYVNDKTLGDDTLTASPAPVYVLEPNILTAAEARELRELEGFGSVTGWQEAVTALYNKARNPADLAGNGGYLAGLVQDTLGGGQSTGRDIEVGDTVTAASLEAKYFMIYHPEDPVWVWFDSADTKYDNGTVTYINSKSSNDNAIDVDASGWDNDIWVGGYRLEFTSGAASGSSFEITSSSRASLDVDESPSLYERGVRKGDQFKIVRTGDGDPVPSTGFRALRAGILPPAATPSAVVDAILAAINGDTEGSYTAARSADNPLRISMTLEVAGHQVPTAPRDANTGFSFLLSTAPGSDSSEPAPGTAVPGTFLGPGLALVPSPDILDPTKTFPGGKDYGYVTIVENNDPELGGPVSLFIIKVSKEHRYRGAIKTILSDNIFEEKVTLRHTGDFGGNAEKMIYQWFYREEDGTSAPLPPHAAWKIFPDQSDNVVKGKGQYQVSLEGTGGLLLADNLFFVRYRHTHDVPAGVPIPANGDPAYNGVTWGPKDSLAINEEPGTDYLTWWNDAKPASGTVKGELFAGAGNSPTVDGDYKPQLVSGWIKRVLDRINPYEVRFNDFRNNSVPATYVSMIQQAGGPYVGAVALNPDKNVIENVGLLELYHTVLDRGTALSIDLSSPITTPGINNALLLASSRLSDLYMLLGNEAYGDAQDPTIGFGSDSADYGYATPSIFAFQNQMGTLLDEELSLLRGVDESFARPVFNRLFWNFTKSDGEAAYALNYNISDQNLDGFVDESDAMVLYPQGHGDAWGHYLSALRGPYKLLRHPYFNWVSRSELYNLLDIVISVDFEDERKFANAAAAKARAGAEVVNQTYRSRYVADPDGQWQGYTDPNSDRAWGVEGWARRAGQGALFDWITANAILPNEDSKNTGVVNESLKKIDRSTVTALARISGYHGKIQSTYDNANSGLNPLGLSDEVVPFDIDPNFDIVGSGIQGKMHFEQIYERAEKTAQNALRVFDHANEQQNRVRQQQVTADHFFDETYEQDRAFRNDLISIFGTPYEGTIGAGRPYPSGYSGPDLNLWFYVDVNELSDRTIPAGSGSFAAAFGGFQSSLVTVGNQTADGESLYTSPRFPFFVNDVLNPDDFADGMASDLSAVIGATPVDKDGNLFMNLPLTANDYVFQAPTDWGRRAAPGELQSIISQMLVAEAELALAQGNYDSYIKELVDMTELLEAKSGLQAETIILRNESRDTITSLKAGIITATLAKELLENTIEEADTTSEAIEQFLPKIAGVAFDPTSAPRGANVISSGIAKTIFRGLKIGLSGTTVGLELDVEEESFFGDIKVDKANFEFEIQEALKEIEQHLRNEGTTRIEVFAKIEALRELSDSYRAALQRGIALLDEREDFNKATGASTQQARYQDMAFRTFRNDALSKYRDSFDLAARYAYLAAKAYDYDTNLSPDDPTSARGLLDDVIKARHLGSWSDGEPLVGSGGLADALAVMRDNYGVMKAQLGLNNFQQEVSKISLRQGHFRNKKNEATGTTAATLSNTIWRQVLAEGRKANLWDVPEFRQFCRPPQAESAGPLPGIVLDFPTEIIFGNNLFGWPLGGGDFAYDPTNYATKVRGVGVWLEGYDNSALSVSPRVYLVPAGLDTMTIPNSSELKTRTWNIVDQRIPAPFLTGDTDLQNPNFIPSIHSLNGSFAEIRKFSSFRAYSDTAPSSSPSFDEMTFDSRLVGRSVWNTKWLLIIPGGTLSADGNAGLDRLIQDVSDIKLYFSTLGYSGN